MSNDNPRLLLELKLRKWLATPVRVSRQYTYPEFSSRIIYCIRGAIVAAVTSAIILTPKVAENLQIRGIILVASSGIVVSAQTLGASIRTAVTTVLGGLISTVYCTALIAIFNPYTDKSTSLAVAFPALAFITFAVFYIRSPLIHIQTKRMTVVACSISLLQWSYGRVPNPVLLPVETWASMGLGTLIGLLVTLIPMPVIPTAHTESRVRATSFAHAVRNCLAAYIIAYTRGPVISTLAAGPSSGGLDKQPSARGFPPSRTPSLSKGAKDLRGLESDIRMDTPNKQLDTWVTEVEPSISRVRHYTTLPSVTTSSQSPHITKLVTEKDKITSTPTTAASSAAVPPVAFPPVAPMPHQATSTYSQGRDSTTGGLASSSKVTYSGANQYSVGDTGGAAPRTDYHVHLSSRLDTILDEDEDIASTVVHTVEENLSPSVDESMEIQTIIDSDELSSPGARNELGLDASPPSPVSRIPNLPPPRPISTITGSSTPTLAPDIVAPALAYKVAKRNRALSIQFSPTATGLFGLHRSRRKGSRTGDLGFNILTLEDETIDTLEFDDLGDISSALAAKIRHTMTHGDPNAKSLLADPFGGEVVTPTETTPNAEPIDHTMTLTIAAPPLEANEGTQARDDGITEEPKLRESKVPADIGRPLYASKASDITGEKRPQSLFISPLRPQKGTHSPIVPSPLAQSETSTMEMTKLVRDDKHELMESVMRGEKDLQLEVIEKEEWSLGESVEDRKPKAQVASSQFLQVQMNPVNLDNMGKPKDPTHAETVIQEDLSRIDGGSGPPSVIQREGDSPPFKPTQGPPPPPGATIVDKRHIWPMLIRADIDDLMEFCVTEIGLLRHAVEDAEWEVWYELYESFSVWTKQCRVKFSRVWQRALRFARFQTYETHRDHETGSQSLPNFQQAPSYSTLNTWFRRLVVWLNAAVIANQIFRSVETAEREARKSPQQSRFFTSVRDPLCQLAIAFGDYMSFASRFSIRKKGIQDAPPEDLSLMEQRKVEIYNSVNSIFQAIEHSRSAGIATTQIAGAGGNISSRNLTEGRQPSQVLGHTRELRYASPGSSVTGSKPQAVISPARFAVVSADLEQSRESLAESAFIFACLRLVQNFLAATNECFGIDDPNVAEIRENIPKKFEVRDFLRKFQSETPSDVADPKQTTSHMYLRQVEVANLTLWQQFRINLYLLFPWFMLGTSRGDWKAGIWESLKQLVDIRQVIRALKAMGGVTLAAGIAIALSGTFGVNVFFWAPMSAAYVVGSADGGVLRTSAVRISGTLLGTSTGYIFLLLSGDNLIAICAVLTLIIAAFTYARGNPKYYFWASVAALSTASTMLGIGSTGEPLNKGVIEDLAIGRIKQTLLGVFCAMFFSLAVFPASARAILKSQMTAALQNITISCDISFQELYNAFITNGCPEDIPFLIYLKNSQVLLLDLPDLIQEAETEPSLWRASFAPQSSRYKDIVKAIERLTNGIRLVHSTAIAVGHGNRFVSALPPEQVVPTSYLLPAPRMKLSRLGFQLPSPKRNSDPTLIGRSTDEPVGINIEASRTEREKQRGDGKDTSADPEYRTGMYVPPVPFFFSPHADKSQSNQAKQTTSAHGTRATARKDRETGIGIASRPAKHSTTVRNVQLGEPETSHHPRFSIPRVPQLRTRHTTTAVFLSQDSFVFFNSVSDRRSVGLTGLSYNAVPHSRILIDRHSPRGYFYSLSERWSGLRKKVLRILRMSLDLLGIESQWKQDLRDPKTSASRQRGYSVTGQPTRLTHQWSTGTVPNTGTEMSPTRDTQSITRNSSVQETELHSRRNHSFGQLGAAGSANVSLMGTGDASLQRRRQHNTVQIYNTGDSLDNQSVVDIMGIDEDYSTKKVDLDKTELERKKEGFEPLGQHALPWLPSLSFLFNKLHFRTALELMRRKHYEKRQYNPANTRAPLPPALLALPAAVEDLMIEYHYYVEYSNHLLKSLTIDYRCSSVILLCFESSSFAIGEVVNAVVGIARHARRLVHSEGRTPPGS